MRFETIPGEQAQVDYGEFQVTLPDGTVKRCYLFAMILGFSRQLFVRLMESCDLPSLLEAHCEAFEFFGYGFRPKVAPAYAAWVKGKIERPMEFVRESWWRG